MTIKSLTGSRKVVDCISYHAVEKIETEITFEGNSNREGALTPHGMTCNPLLGTGLA